MNNHEPFLPRILMLQVLRAVCTEQPHDSAEL